MKKMFIAAVLLVSSFYTTVQAGTGDKPGKAAKTTDNVSSRVKESFSKQFPLAQYAVWQLLSNHEIYLVRFVQNDEGVVAYVDQQGTLIATARITKMDKLPSTVKHVLETKYSNAQVSEALELVLEGQLNYLIKLEDNMTKTTIKITGNGDYSVIKKEKIAKKGF